MDRQGPPASIHLTVNAVHAARVKEFLSDLDECVASLNGQSGEMGSYASTE
jgi:hypothetical protein